MFEYPVYVSILLVMVVLMVFGVIGVVKLRKLTKKLGAENRARQALREQSVHAG